jgi:hypothetical protein
LIEARLNGWRASPLRNSTDRFGRHGLLVLEMMDDIYNVPWPADIEDHEAQEED